MPAAPFSCPKCLTPLAIEPGTAQVAAACPKCATLIEAFFFPAFFRPEQTGAASTALMDSTEASCFYHPQKQAVQVCDGCGRMMCALCSVDLGDRHLCPTCIASGRKKGKLTTLEDSRMRYDNIALAMAIIGVLVYYLSVFLAPATIYTSIRYWNSPGSILGASKVRYVIAMTIATLAIVGWTLFFGMLIYHTRK
jgi:hypothetical protein